MSHISTNDLVFYQNDDGKIMSGGFSIDSLLLNKGGSPMYTITKGGGDSNNIFDGFVVPTGLLYQQPNKQNKKQFFNYDEHSNNNEFLKRGGGNSDVLPEDLHTLLLGMIENDRSKNKRERKSRKQRKEVSSNKEKKNSSKKNIIDK